MKILLVDDDPRHQESANRLLGEAHDLTIVANPDTAVDKLRPQYDEAKEAELLLAAGFPKEFKPWDQSVSEEQRERFLAEQRKAHSASRISFPYEAVLLDLLMPATSTAMGDKGQRFVGQLMPYGYSLALYAIQEGAPRVGILTETNHHEHPMSAALDPLDMYPDAMTTTIGTSRFVLARELSLLLPVLPEKACSKCGGAGEQRTEGGNTYQCYSCKGSKVESFHGKDWAKLLQLLVAETPAVKASASDLYIY